MSDNIMMIGPSQAGKTTLLSVLRLASARRLKDEKTKDEKKVRIRPLNDDAKLLFERALDIVLNGSIVHAPNAMASRYEFELICDVEKTVARVEYEDEPGMFPWSKPTRIENIRHERVTEPKAFTLNVLDGKGGDIFGDRDPLEDINEYNRRRAEMVEMASQSAALIVCVNSNDSNNTALFFRGLQRFLDEVHKSGMRTPFARVAIVLTQADRSVEQFGSSAQSELEKMNPATVAADRLGFYAMDGLFQALEPAASKQVYAGWASVYGFIEDEGSVNFDSVNNRIALFQQDDARWTDKWLPYGVIEPFLFACTGEVRGLERLRHKG